MIEVVIGSETFAVPSKLDECNVHQLATYAKAFIFTRDSIFIENIKEGKLDIKNRLMYEVAMLRVLYASLGCSWETYQKISAEQKHYLIYDEKILDFYFTGKFEKAPVIFVSGLTGPSNEYQLTAEEFSFCDTAYMAYHKSQNDNVLNTFAAVLLRKKRLFYFLSPGLDQREPFNKQTIEHRLPLVSQIPHDYKVALWFWYHKYRAQLPDLYPYAFNSSNESKAASSGWLEVLLASAENGTFGNYHEICKTQHHLMFADMNRRIQNSKAKPNA